MVSPNSGSPNSSQPMTTTQTQNLSRSSQHSGMHQPITADAAIELFKEYSRERPEVVAMWAFGIGFVLGWKLKPW